MNEPKHQDAVFALPIVVVLQEQVSDEEIYTKVYEDPKTIIRDNELRITVDVTAFVKKRNSQK